MFSGQAYRELTAEGRRLQNIYWVPRLSISVRMGGFAMNLGEFFFAPALGTKADDGLVMASGTKPERSTEALVRGAVVHGALELIDSAGGGDGGGDEAFGESG